MKCSNCGYESNIEFSYCPYCGKKNNNENQNNFVNEIINNISESINEITNNIFKQISDSREKFLDDKQNNIKNLSLDKEIQFEDIKLPYGFNKNFIQKKFDIFTINSKSGGEFFPNKEIGKIIITIVISFIVGFLPSPLIVVACSPLNDELYVKSYAGDKYHSCLFSS